MSREVHIWVTNFHLAQQQQLLPPPLVRLTVEPVDRQRGRELRFMLIFNFDLILFSFIFWTTKNKNTNKIE